MRRRGKDGGGVRKGKRDGGQWKEEEEMYIGEEIRERKYRESGRDCGRRRRKGGGRKLQSLEMTKQEVGQRREVGKYRRA